MNEITSMIPQYGELNRIYTDILSGKGFSFEKQKFISDFYRQHEDTQAFETSLIGMVFETDAEQKFFYFEAFAFRINDRGVARTAGRVQVPEDKSREDLKKEKFDAYRDITEQQHRIALEAAFTLKDEYGYQELAEALNRYLCLCRCAA